MRNESERGTNKSIVMDLELFGGRLNSITLFCSLYVALFYFGYLNTARDCWLNHVILELFYDIRHLNKLFVGTSYSFKNHKTFLKQINYLFIINNINNWQCKVAYFLSSKKWYYDGGLGVWLRHRYGFGTKCLKNRCHGYNHSCRCFWNWWSGNRIYTNFIIWIFAF